ncbi:hypothetical protein [Mycobacterium sp. shizuoka-1]|uniref:hypothetical protein n=1 Tax=Mycobacterium sp. shizuoka-1 TaxID=2039281 RepID=UPI000C05DC43|nr:hypothetical protein [Mycobacterium sp. shizuoka-1]GAY16459.1 hypothetical protein MSZK_31850 [Mycobacterium sp. shizuoka-1]
MGEVFIGSEALASGALTRHALRRFHDRLLPDVYQPRGQPVSLRDRTIAAWLWSRRRAVIAGAAAAALHGSQWINPTEPIELIWDNGRPPEGLIVRNESLADDEVTRVAGLPVTTLARTAFDVGRHLPRARAIARLDALMRAESFSSEDILLLAKRYPGARGIRRLREVVPLVDRGAASPRETWLRLLLIDAGLPIPTTQIPLYDDWGLVAVLDMGWEEFMVAAEYDGDQHRTDRGRYVWDQKRARLVAGMGWNAVRVIKEDRPDDVIARVRDALMSRGWRP